MTLPRRVAVKPTGLSNSTRSLSYLTAPAPPAVPVCLPSLPTITLIPPLLQDPLAAFAGLLRTSSRTGATLLEVELLHSRALKSGLARNSRVCSGILHLYVKCGCLDLAHQVFGEIPERGTFAWTVLISGCSQHGRAEMGLCQFAQMLDEGVRPNGFTLSSILKCCVGINDIDLGKRIHGWILRNGIDMDVVLQNSILDLYAKLGAFEHANRAFQIMTEKDSVSWNIVIGVYLQNGDIHGSMDLFRKSEFKDVSSWNTIISGQMQGGFHLEALELLYQMVNVGPGFNQFTFSVALTLAGTLAFLDLGRQLHNKMLRIGFEHDAFVRNSLVDMYCKCGQLEVSSIIFNRSSLYVGGSLAMTILFSTMVAGFVQNGKDAEALEFLRRMLREGVTVDRFTLTSFTAACSNIGIVEQCRHSHAFVEKSGHCFDIHLTSAIVHMYAKCGSLEDARNIFDSVQSKNVILWTSLLCSYALHGKARTAVLFFERMLEEKIMPNEISFVGLLSACSHGGLIKEGYEYFKSMKEDYGITPGIEHFTCMVDLFGRSGLLDEAKKFIFDNNISHRAVVWRAMLSACRIHNHIEHAMLAYKYLSQLSPFEAGSYILLSNICATKSKWLDTFGLRSLMQNRGVRKQPGISWIHLKNRVHTFVAGDTTHPKADEIYAYLGKLIGRLKEVGYSSRTEMVLHDVEEEQRETTLSFHSEKLAIAFGIISTPSGVSLRVMKNLRVCVDCHEAIKHISQVTDREIILRDSHRFHHFKNAKCSCEDFW